MFIDTSGSLGAEHARDLRRAAAAYRFARLGRGHVPVLRAFAARTQLGPVFNYRSR
jgi:hypothetical protein